jgi:uncharacterized protein
MKYKYIEKELAYDGTQLRSLFGYLDHGVMGDSIVAFAGPCDVSFDHMVDGEDLLAQSPIRGGSMLHFIVECFGINLQTTVAFQRILAALVFEELSGMGTIKTLKREGDDIYIGEGKLSISIATSSPISGLIHFAVNITNENTPVKTACLSDLGIKPKAFADALSARFISELRTIDEARCKVKWVR